MGAVMVGGVIKMLTMEGFYTMDKLMERLFIGKLVAFGKLGKGVAGIKEGSIRRNKNPWL